MSDATPSRLGQVNQTGTVTTLFLDVFSGEVMEAFDTAQVTMDRINVKTLSSGKSAQFPFTWKSSARFHTPGVELTGTPITHAQRSITIDDVLLADVFVAEVDELKNHYEVRSKYTHQLAEALANVIDTNVFRSIYVGSEIAADSLFTGNAGGTQLTGATFISDVAVFKAGVYDAAQTLDEKNVPANDRYIAVKPAEFFGMLENGEFVHRDYDGNGSKARAKLPFVADLQVLKSNNIPRTSDTSNTNIPTALRVDFTPYVAAVWQRDAAALVKLMDITVESQYDIRRQGTLFIAKLLCGQSYLRPESCISLALS